MGHAVDAHAVQRVQVLRGERLVRRAVGQHAPLLQQHHAVAHLPGELQVVRGHQQCQPTLVREPAQQLRDLDLVVQVERGRRLVEDQQASRVVPVFLELGQRARDDDALLLAAAQRVEVAALEIGRAGGRERAAHRQQVGGGLEAERPEVRVPSHQREVEDGVVEDRMNLLRHHGQPPGEHPLGHARDRRVVQPNLAAGGRQGARQDAQQRRLARAVGAEHTRDATACHVERHAVQDGIPAEPAGDVSGS